MSVLNDFEFQLEQS